MKEYIEVLVDILLFANEGLKNSKEGLENYDDDSEADHGDGQQVGRETAYSKVIVKCAQLIIDKLDTTG